jgi:hypothetical protein
MNASKLVNMVTGVLYNGKIEKEIGKKSKPVYKWKMIPVETTPGMGRMMMGVNSSLIYLIYCKNLCKYHNVAPLSTALKNFF